MSLVTIIYLIGFLGEIAVIKTLLFAAICVGAFCTVMACLLADELSSVKKVIPYMRNICIAFICLAPIPSEDTGYKMLAAYGLGEVSQNKDVRRISGKSLELIEKTLDKYMDAENVE